MATPFDSLYQLPIELRQFLSNLAGGTDSSELNDGAVTTSKLGALAVTAAKIAADAITTAKILAGAVTRAKASVFISSEQTGTGSSQNIAHGLSAAPTGGVIVMVTESDGNAFDVAEGAHDGTNVVVTVTSGVKFKVLAWA